MHSPESLLFTVKIPFTKVELARIWHIDPCKDGTDDSCGRFMRSRHGDQSIVDEAAKDLEFDWDRTFTMSREDHDDSEDGPYDPKTRYLGMFHPKTGLPLMSAHSITMWMFLIVAQKALGRERGRKYLRNHMTEILLFAENPSDSLRDSICLTFGDDDYATKDQFARKRMRTERIRQMVHCVYGQILRDTRPWWKSPTFHFHHWKVDVPLWMRFNRWAFTRCCKCGGRFKFGEIPVTDQWDSERPRFLRGERDKYHSHHCGVARCGEAETPNIDVI